MGCNVVHDIIVRVCIRLVQPGIIVCVYIYIYRERERVIYTHTYIHTYMHIHMQRYIAVLYHSTAQCGSRVTFLLVIHVTNLKSRYTVYEAQHMTHIKYYCIIKQH